MKKLLAGLALLALTFGAQAQKVVKIGVATSGGTTLQIGRAHV